MKNKSAKHLRKSNLEWLRIIAIIMIISYHYVVHSEFDFQVGAGKVFLEIVSYGGKAGVNIFCLLMGYFGIKSSKFSVEKLIKIEEQILFFSMIGLLANILFFKGNDVSTLTLLKSFFPVIFEQYWFMTAYVIVYLMSPFINRLLLSLEKETYIKLLVLELLLWGIIPFFSLQETTGMGFTQLIWFIVMYTFGAYMRLYKSKTSSSQRYFKLVLLCIITMLIIIVTLNILGIYSQVIFNHITYFRWSNSPVIIVFSLSLFRLFEQLDIQNSVIINFIARGTLGVYLFHENIFMQPIIWQNIICGEKYINNIWILISVC